MSEHSTAVLDPQTDRTDSAGAPSREPEAARAGERPVTPAAAPVERGDAAREPRRCSDPDEKLMLWGLLGFFLLGLYAAVFVALGMWLTP